MNYSKDTILIVSRYSSIYGGNFIPSIYSLGKLLKAKGKTIYYAFPFEAKERNWAQEISQDSFSIFYFRNDKHIREDIKGIVKHIKPSILYTHFLSSIFVKSLLLFDNRLKAIIHIHSDFSSIQHISIIKFIIKFFINLMKNNYTHIYVSQSLFLKSHEKKKIYVPNAICPIRMKHNKLDIYKHINRDIVTKNYIFLAFGWTPILKGIDILCKAFSMMNHEAILMIIHDVSNGADIEALVNDNVDDNDKKTNIIFLGPQEDVDSLYSIADCFISCSRSEGFSYSILEALSKGVPVIMSDIVGTSWANKYEGVFVYEVENDKMLSSIMDKQVLLGKNIKIDNRSVLCDYSFDQWLDNISEVFIHGC